MPEAKIAFKLGAIEFSGEGDKGWLSEQLEKILDKAPDLVKIVPQTATPQVSVPQHQHHLPMGPDPQIAQLPLATFLKDKDATTNQIKKFFVTAVWLEAKGKNRLSVSDVTKALKDSNQKRLGNASQCLSDNISKGFCERDGKQFFVTEEGKRSL